MPKSVDSASKYTARDPRSLKRRALGDGVGLNNGTAHYVLVVVSYLRVMAYRRYWLALTKPTLGFRAVCSTANWQLYCFKLHID
jgi:hypothetical protein